MTAALLSLEDGITCLSLAPEVGGSIANWSGTVALQRPAGARRRHPTAAGLLPAGALVQSHCRRRLYRSRWLVCPSRQQPQRPLADPRQRLATARQVSEHSATEIVLQLDSQKPFAYRAVQRFRLHGGRLDIDLQVIHLDERAPGMVWADTLIFRAPHTPACAPRRNRSGTATTAACPQNSLRCQRPGTSSRLATYPHSRSIAPLPAGTVNSRSFRKTAITNSTVAATAGITCSIVQPSRVQPGKVQPYRVQPNRTSSVSNRSPIRSTPITCLVAWACAYCATDNPPACTSACSTDH